MRKNGFTLAEVLITMAIIGVIAAVTLPSLNVNVNENSSATRFKKAISTLNTIGSAVSANDGFTYSDAVPGAIQGQGGAFQNRGNVNGQLRRQLFAVLDRYGKLNLRLTGQAPGGDCTNNAVHFKDGSVLCFTTSNDDGNPIHAIIDVNGLKQPNTLSTCADANCSTRSIQDQFNVTLTGDEAFPGHTDAEGNIANPGAGDYAALWATDSLVGQAGNN